jgi:hypothetical protein
MMMFSDIDEVGVESPSSQQKSTHLRVVSRNFTTYCGKKDWVFPLRWVAEESCCSAQEYELTQVVQHGSNLYLIGIVDPFLNGDLPSSLRGHDDAPPHGVCDLLDGSTSQGEEIPQYGFLRQRDNSSVAEPQTGITQRRDWDDSPISTAVSESKYSC